MKLHTKVERKYMSRELLKRALEIMDKAGWFVEHEAYAFELMGEIKTYLAKPEPEPVAWMVENHPASDTFVNFTPKFNSHFETINCKVTPLYTVPPDQTERVGVLIAEKVVLEQQLAAKDARIVELEMEWRMKVSKIIHLEQQLAEITHWRIYNDIN